MQALCTKTGNRVYPSCSEILPLNAETKNLGVNLKPNEYAVLPSGFPRDTGHPPLTKLGNTEDEDIFPPPTLSYLMLVSKLS